MDSINHCLGKQHFVNSRHDIVQANSQDQKLELDIRREEHIKDFVTYLDEQKITYQDWTIFQSGDEWTKTFAEMQQQGRLDV